MINRGFKVISLILILVAMLSGVVYAFDGNLWNGGSALTVTQEGEGTTQIIVNGGSPYTLTASPQSFQLNPGDIATIRAPGSSIICEQDHCNDYKTTDDFHTVKMDSTYEVTVVFNGV